MYATLKRASSYHRLLFPSTGFEDVKSLFAILATPDFSPKHMPQGITLDTTRIAVSGESGGGYAARAAGIFAKPKPRAVLLQYAMGGQLLDDHGLSIKSGASTPVESKGGPRETLAPLLDEPQQPISYDPLISLGDEPLHPGQAQNHILGQKLSHTLRELPYAKRMDAIPADLRPAILQSQLDEAFPPRFLLHGKADPLVLSTESQQTYARLRQLGDRAELVFLDGAGHSLLKLPGPENGGTTAGPPKLAIGAEEIRKKGFAFLLNELRA